MKLIGHGVVVTRYAVCLIGLAFAVHEVAAGQPDLRSKAAPDTSDLVELVTSFFQTNDEARRSDLARKIEQQANGDAGAVADALGRITLWPATIPPQGVFTFESAGLGGVAVEYRLPHGYDPASKRYPVVLCYPSTFGQSAAVAIEKFAEMFGDAGKDHIFLAPSKPLGGTFYQRSPAAAGDMAGFFREVRRRFRIDTDGVVLTGVGPGADAAWIVALTHPDFFSAALCVAGIPEVPYPEQTLPLLLENLGGMRLVSIWATRKGEHEDSRIARVAQTNQFIVEAAALKSLSVRGLELSVSSQQDLQPDLEAVEQVSNQRRLGLEARRSFRFRYPLQGVTGWVRQVAPRGDLWLHDQLSILPSPGSGYGPYISSVIEGQMGLLVRRFEANTFTVQCRGCKRIELTLPVELVDWSQPVTVLCNGKRRFEGMITPDISAMLNAAYDTWEFQHPIGARRSISVKRVSRGQ